MALEQGLGVLLVDYVAEVCGDPFLTSADPVEAYLMDGRCMAQWAHRALHRSRARSLQVWLVGFRRVCGTWCSTVDVKSCALHRGCRRRRPWPGGAQGRR